MSETEGSQFEVHDQEALARARAIMNASEAPKSGHAPRRVTLDA